MGRMIQKAKEIWIQSDYNLTVPELIQKVKE